MARDGDAALVHGLYVDGVTIRPLRDGDTATVAAVFAALGPASRVRRFGGAKPRLSDAELAVLARVDADHHSLVAYADGAPVALAQLVRHGRAAEVAFAVADAQQRRGIGSQLARLLAADARAAGIVELTATVCGDNPRAVSLLRRCGQLLPAAWVGGERELRLVL
jgi:ribosomal protein S18 acetylase RimI-like enzyme